MRGPVPPVSGVALGPYRSRFRPGYFALRVVMLPVSERFPQNGSSATDDPEPAARAETRQGSP
jgi:hypothetical protein